MAESQGTMVTAVAVVFAVLTFFVIVLRLWARIFLVGSLGTDDPLLVIACFLSWAFSAVTVLAVQHGLGDHIEEVTARGTMNMVMYSFYVWLSSIFYNATLGFIKISVLALYMRLGDRWLRRLAIVMIGVVACQAGGNVFACIFQCSPVSAGYDIRIPESEKRCININAFYLANAAVNIFTDVLTYTLPVRLVLNLQIPRRQKIGLAVMLCLGLMACVSSIIRITFVPAMLVSADATYVITGAMYWSVIELNVGILAASIPSFKAIATRYMPRLLGSSYDKNTKSKSLSGGAKLSGFQKMSRSRSTGGKGVVSVDDGYDDRSGSQVGLRNLDGRGRSGSKDGEAAGAGGGKPMGLDTYIERVSSDASSDEVPYAQQPPKGQIGVKTQITTHYN